MATTISELLGIDETQIIPGTTPKIEIAIDNDIITSTSSVRIDVVQNDKVILQITEADIDKENKKITYIFARWLIKYFCYDVIEYLVRLIEYLF